MLNKLLASMVIIKNYVNMSFRNHKFRPSAPTSIPVVEQTLKTSVVDGVDTFTRVDVDSLSKPLLPSADDYKLSALLQSGSPLNYVNPQIYENPERDAQYFVENNLTDELSDVPRETEPVEVPRETEPFVPQ